MTIIDKDTFTQNRVDELMFDNPYMDMYEAQTIADRQWERSSNLDELAYEDYDA